ncbi:MAG TPA: hypothetical protein VGN95_21345 [Pyrinomonadaceae bacterium]|jgi:hypothetical protein|nr:hypothetical protein [Pyrinomonadaceae bacterium]
MADETTKSTDATQRIALSLNPVAVLLPAQNAVVLSIEIVDFFTDAVNKADLSKKPTNDATQYKFKSPQISADERRAMYENWIYSKAFQDLMRGVRASLEEAYLFLELLSKPHSAGSSTTLEEFLTPFKREAAKLQFPPLLNLVNSKLNPPLDFVEAYNSLQRARNCMEHRNGVVGDVDAPGGGVMILSFPRVKMFYLRGDEEIEVEAGHVVDAQDGKDEVQIKMKLDLRERRFSRYQRLAITSKDFNEVAFACNYFAEQLASKVAAVPPITAPAA